MINRLHRCRRGFTLIELLSAMAILLLITMFVGKLFADASRLWKLGNRRVFNAVEGRSVIDFMVREMSSAIADGTLVLAHDVDVDRNILGMDSDRIYFVTVDQRPGFRGTGTPMNRQVKQVSYHLEPMRDTGNPAKDIPGRYRIVRSGIEDFNSAWFTCYDDPLWWQEPWMNDLSAAATLAENVRTMEFWVYDQQGKLRAGVDYNSRDHGPPGWIEIYIEMLGDDDAVKASLLSGQAAIDFADRASRRYVGRVYFNQGRGYAPDT